MPSARKIFAIWGGIAPARGQFLFIAENLDYDVRDWNRTVTTIHGGGCEADNGQIEVKTWVGGHSSAVVSRASDLGWLGVFILNDIAGQIRRVTFVVPAKGTGPSDPKGIVPRRVRNNHSARPPANWSRRAAIDTGNRGSR